MMDSPKASSEEGNTEKAALENTPMASCDAANFDVLLQFQIPDQFLVVFFLRSVAPNFQFCLRNLFHNLFESPYGVIHVFQLHKSSHVNASEGIPLHVRPRLNPGSAVGNDVEGGSRAELALDIFFLEVGGKDDGIKLIHFFQNRSVDLF